MKLSRLTDCKISRDVDITALTADSREVSPGALFAALSGAKADGRTFIPKALAAGAAAILTDDETIALPESVALVLSETPRRDFALMAARFYDGQPDTVVAVTGSNGKSSTVHFCRQIWRYLGHSAASLGTIGIEADGILQKPAMTTPDPVTLHRDLRALEQSGITHLAMEASSHGLDQYRLDGVRLKAAGFTGLSRDHLDYHGTMDDYLKAKMRLFTEVLPDGATAVLNADVPEYEQIAKACRARRITVFSYGRKGDDLRLLGRTVMPEGQELALSLGERQSTVFLPLVGEFQAYNALCALGLVMTSGDHLPPLTKALEHLQGVRGRLERVGVSPRGAAVYVDFAHTPDGLETMLSALRPHAAGRLHVVFGCGGDRDRGKRPMMGDIAARLADRAIVTDDNPRSEDPAAIRAEVMAGAPQLIEIGDRRTAITRAIESLEKNDILVIAGKGHEQGQIVGDRILPFDDAAVARSCLNPDGEKE